MARHIYQEGEGLIHDVTATIRARELRRSKYRYDVESFTSLMQRGMLLRVCVQAALTGLLCFLMLS